MTDLTKIDKPFGLLDADTQKALREWPHGLDKYWGDGDWVRQADWMSFHPAVTYRACPAPVTPDTIDWSHVAPQVRYMQRPSAEAIHAILYDANMTQLCSAGAFASYQRGTCDWKDSLVERPA